MSTLWEIADTLEKDGHISLIHGYSHIPIGRINAQGRVFIEQGGYKDTTSRLDKMIFWFKNHKVFSILLVVFAVISALLGIILTTILLIEWWQK